MEPLFQNGPTLIHTHQGRVKASNEKDEAVFSRGVVEIVVEIEHRFTRVKLLKYAGPTGRIMRLEFMWKSRMPELSVDPMLIVAPLEIG